MNSALRPTLDLSHFLELISQQELSDISIALRNAFDDGYNTIGVNEFIPKFRAVYSSCFFPYICGYLEKFVSINPEWEVRRNSMTFILIKIGACQFHFYKGNKYSALRADSKRKRAILFQEEYPSLERLPSVVFQHYSDRHNAVLLGLHALFYERGKLVESLDVLNNIPTQQKSANFNPIMATPVESKTPQWKPKRGKGKKGNQDDLPAAEVS